MFYSARSVRQPCKLSVRPPTLSDVTSVFTSRLRDMAFATHCNRVVLHTDISFWQFLESPPRRSREGVLADSTQLHEVSPVSGFSLRLRFARGLFFFPSSIRPLFSMIDVLRSWWGRVLCPGILVGILLGASGIFNRYLWQDRVVGRFAIPAVI